MTENLLKIINKYVGWFVEQNRVFDTIEPKLKQFYSSASFQKIKDMQFSFQQEIYTMQMIILSEDSTKPNKKNYAEIEKLLNNYKIFIDALQKKISVNNKFTANTALKSR